MRNLIIRTCTGIAYVALIVASLYFQTRFYTFSLIFALVTGVGLFEFYRITNMSERVSVPTAWLIASGIVLYFCCFWYNYFGGTWPFIAYGLCLIATIISELFRHSPQPNHNIAFAIMGQALIALPFGFLNHIAPSASYDWHWCLSLFVLIWVSDTGAYLVGCSIGKHPLAPSISPKKTWEGLIGGAILTLAASGVIAWITGESLVVWLIFGLLVEIFGTFGDLCESQLKRTVALKDSGKIMPGHGGVLDRFDSLLMTTPVIYIYLEILKTIGQL
ncbi:MAG: phosphatidate cytidylyltransferase [Paludibacteraceae bacterium]|nr:phosphatidate cytidylyltransferase [Paludibacteraceae bacterium]